MLVLAATSSAQERTDTLHWTFSECIAYAHDHNLQLEQSRLQEEYAKYSLEAARAQWQPTLGFATTQSLSNSPWGKGDKNSYSSSYGLNASWNAYDGGERAASIKRAKADTRRTSEASRAEMQNIDTQILSIYINMLYSREAIAVNRELAKVSAAQESRGKTLFESGRIAKPDYAQLLAQAEGDKYNLVSAEAAYARQCLDLKQLLKLDIYTNIDIIPVEFGDDDVTNPLPPMAESYQMALAQSASLKALQINEEMAGINIDAAKASGHPSVSLNAGVGSGYYSIQSDGWGEQMKQGLNEQIGLTLSVPIFNQKKSKTAVAQAKIDQLNTRLDISNKEEEIGQTLEGCYIDMKSARERYEAGLSQLSAAELSSELLNEKFDVGYVEITELLQAHSTLSSARHELLQAKYMAVLARKMIEYLRTSSVTL